MDLSKEETEARKTLADTLGQPNKITSKNLARADELGTALSFQSGIPVFKRTLQLFRDLSKCTLDKLPLETLRQLKQSADRAVQNFNQIKEFNPVPLKGTLHKPRTSS